MTAFKEMTDSASRTHKFTVATAYDTAAVGFDADTRRFFHNCARRLVELTALAGAQTVLDLATGTGAAAFAAASVLPASAHVFGVDLAPKMLAQARRKPAPSGQPRTTFVQMDAEWLGFDRECFDAAVCAFGIFYMPDITSALREWRRVLRPAGWVAYSSFGRTAFQPLSDLYEARARHYGSDLPQPTAFAWQRLTSAEACRAWLQQADFQKVQVVVEQHGYYLKDAGDWWQLLWNGSWRQAIAHLNPEQLERFKSEHLAEVQAIATPQGLWLDIEAIFAIGQKP